MKRTQIYLDEDIYELLKLESRIKKKRISYLIREALREKYTEETKAALIKNICGIWKDRDIDSDEVVTGLRSGSDNGRIYEK